MPAKNLEAARESRRKWYYNNKEKAKKAVLDRKIELTEWYKEYKHTLCCETCGEDHWSCLDFHHINPEEKEYHISHMAAMGYSKERIINEINDKTKILILCSNCHRKLHHP